MQWLGALAALAEDQRLAVSTHVRWFTTTYNYRSTVSGSPIWPPWASAFMGTFPCTDADAPIIKNENLWEWIDDSAVRSSWLLVFLQRIWVQFPENTREDSISLDFLRTCLHMYITTLSHTHTLFFFLKKKDLFCSCSVRDWQKCDGHTYSQPSTTSPWMGTVIQSKILKCFSYVFFIA